uniref:Wzz/FepE/Etk N-terminal domain-containing protein n=1 Tax=uncultured Mucilaginibacter sp. TaxID=797541 RepID=UPI0026390E31
MNRKISEDKDSNFSSSFIFRYLPYWPLFLLLTLIALGGAWFYLKFATPQYEVHARILIKDEKDVSEDAKTLESLDLISPKKTINNEMEVIQSKTLLTNVVKNLDLYAPVSEEQRFKSISAYSSSPVTIVADSNNMREVAKVYFTADKNSVKIGNKTYILDEWVATPYGRLKFKKNIYRTPEETGKKLYFSLIAPKNVVSSLASRLKVTAANKMPGIVDLDFTDESSVRGEDIVNELIKVYNKSIMDEKNALASNTLKFINERLARVEDDMVTNEHKLQSYKANKTVVGTQGKLFLEKVGSNDQQKMREININREQSLKSHLYEFLQQKKEETQLSYVSDLFGSKIVDRAKASEYPVSPKKKFAYLSAVLLALVTGFGIVVGKETLSSKVMFQKEIESLTKLPVIGEITAEKSKNATVIGKNPKTLIAEQFRKLRTTLNYLGIGNKQKRILITSAISGEGKSFVATNLAISLALT